MTAITIQRGRQVTLSLSKAGAMIDTGEVVEFRVGPIVNGQLIGARYFRARSDGPNANGSQCEVVSTGLPVTVGVELTPADTLLIPGELVNGRHAAAAYELLVYDADESDAPRSLLFGDVVIVNTHDS